MPAHKNRLRSKIATATIGLLALSLIGPASAAPERPRVTRSERSRLPASWNQFHNTVDRAGVQSAESILGVGNVPNLTVLWSKTPTPVDEIWSSAAVVGGVIYFGSDNGKLYARDALTGVVLWSFNSGSAIRSSPAVVDGVVYFGSNNNKVYAVDIVTGTKIWSYATGDDIDDASPLVVNGKVYIGSLDGYFYALNAYTGKLVWKSSSIWDVRKSAAYWNGTVYVGTDKSKLYAFNASTGAVKWTATLGGRVRCTPAVVNGTVYVGSDDYRVYAYDATTGAFKWKSGKMPNSGIVRSAPAVWNNTVYIDTGETTPMGSHVFALDANTGMVLWKTEMSDYSTSSIAVANGVLYTGSFDHQLHAFNAATGAKLWTSGFDLMDKGIPASPAVVDGVVYIGNLAGEMFAFSLP